MSKALMALTVPKFPPARDGVHSRIKTSVERRFQPTREGRSPIVSVSAHPPPENVFRDRRELAFSAKA